MGIQEGALRRTYLKEHLMPYSLPFVVRIIACAHRESALGNHRAACLLEVAIDVIVRSGSHEDLRNAFLSTCLVLCEHGVWAMFQRNDEDQNLLEKAERLIKSTQRKFGRAGRDLGAPENARPYCRRGYPRSTHYRPPQRRHQKCIVKSSYGRR